MSARFLFAGWFSLASCTWLVGSLFALFSGTSLRAFLATDGNLNVACAVLPSSALVLSCGVLVRSHSVYRACGLFRLVLFVWRHFRFLQWSVCFFNRRLVLFAVVLTFWLSASLCFLWWSVVRRILAVTRAVVLGAGYVRLRAVVWTAPLSSSRLTSTWVFLLLYSVVRRVRVRAFHSAFRTAGISCGWSGSRIFSARSLPGTFLFWVFCFSYCPLSFPRRGPLFVRLFMQMISINSDQRTNTHIIRRLTNTLGWTRSLLILTTTDTPIIIHR